MCFGSSGKAARLQMIESAQQEARMRQQEEERQARIRQGQAEIDRNFMQFDEPYYDRYRQSVTDYYFPQLDEQFAQAKDKLMAALAGQGMLESSVGAQRLADLDKKYGQERTRLAGHASDTTNELRSRVEKAKTNLYSTNTAAGDPQAISARAQGEAGALVAPQAFTPLGELFTDIIGPIVNFAQARTNALPQQVSGARRGASLAPTTGAGTSRVI